MYLDKNKASTSEEKFKKISEAYQVLSDKNKRREYDDLANTHYTSPNFDNWRRNNRFHDARTIFDHFFNDK